MIHWAAYDPITGDVLEDLPGLRITSSMSTIIGRGDSVTVALPIADRLTDRWVTATQPKRVVIAGIHDPGSPRPSDSTVLWAGWVDHREYGSGPEIMLRLQPPEEWLNRNYVAAQTFTQQPGTAIMRALGLDRVAAQFHGDVIERVSTKRHDRTYTDDQDKTCLSAMQDLMRITDGVEFALTWRIDDNGRLCLVATTAQKLGRRATLDQPAGVLIDRAEWRLTEDAGSTIWTGTATRTGDDRVQVTRRADPLIAQGFLELERRWQPDTGSVSESIIAGYVDAARTAEQDGISALDITVHLDDVMPGRDIGLGDDVVVELANPDLPGVEISTTLRLLGWVADPDPVSGEITEIKPILYDETVV